MKTLKAFALLFVLTVLPVSAELVTDPETGLRTGTIIVNGAINEIGPGVNLNFADLRDANLSGANLSGADFNEANFMGANLTDTNFGDAFASVIGLNGLKIVNLQTELAEKDAKITSLEDRMTALEAQVALLANAGAIQQLQEQIAELSQRPTLEEVRDARAGSVVLTADRENNEVTLNLRVEETDDLKQGTWTTAEGGDLKLTLALAGDKRFMRIALGE